MEDKLVTLAILTYSKAQILKNVLESEGIETYIHNVNLIQPVISSGVRVRIKESDLPQALKITESSAWLAEDVVGEKTPESAEKIQHILIPVDFSESSMKACEFGFNFAKTYGAEIVLMHVYYTPIYASSLPYGDIFNYQILADEENAKTMIQKVHEDLNTLCERIKQQIADGKLPDVKFECTLREGIPEEEIIRYGKEEHPIMIIMGTRGKSQKDMDLIGSVTAEVVERSRVTVFAIPDQARYEDLADAKNLAFLTNFDQRDLVAFENMIHSLKTFGLTISLLHLSDSVDTWDEIKLGGIKEYFHKQYPDLDIQYDIVRDDDLLNNLEEYIDSKNIDIIVMTTYRKNIFARLFNPGFARKMLFHSNTPMLVIK